jgi:hypothetical protein
VIAEAEKCRRPKLEVVRGANESEAQVRAGGCRQSKKAIPPKRTIAAAKMAILFNDTKPVKDSSAGRPTFDWRRPVN